MEAPTVALETEVQSWRSPALLGAWLLFCIGVLALLASAGKLPLGADEYEHLHFAWLVGQGEIPYRDFFEHHHPLLWIVLAPLMRFGPAGLEVAFLARLLCVASAIATAIAVGLIAGRLRDRVAGAWAAAAWLSLGPVQACAYQVRPDPFMVACLAFSLWSWLKPDRRSAFLAGLLWAFAFALLQKAILFLPLIGLVCGCELVGAKAAERRAIWMRASRFALGAFIPLALGATFLLAVGAVGPWWLWAVLFNKSSPPLEGTWFLRGLWSWRKAAQNTTTIPLVCAAGAALWIAWRGKSLERWLLLGGTALLLALQLLPKRPYYVYALPSSLLIAVLIGVGAALILARVRSARAKAWLGPVLAATFVLQALPGLRDTLLHEDGLEFQRQQSRYVLQCLRPEDVVYQGYPPFAIQAHDAGFMGWMPLEMSLRAADLGLACGPDAETILREKQPAFVGLDTAVLPMREERERLQQFLIDGLGYRWDERWHILARP